MSTCPLSSVSPSPSLPLPPTPRDFDIHRMHLVYFASTRTIAQKHGISQTRVRQVVQRVSQWLAAALPVKTDAEQEQETRLAQHLAADQLRNQLEDLRILWDGTHDPKYFRQQTRVIAALARLGIVPGTIESLAADATTGPFDPTEPQPPWSEDDPWFDSSLADFRHSTSDSRPPAPPSEDCSPSSPADPASALAPSNAPPTTPVPIPISDAQRSFLEGSLEGLKLMEQRLLTLLDNVRPDDSERRLSLSQTLKSVQSQKASLEIRLSPTSPPKIIPLQPSSTDQKSPIPVLTPVS